MRFEPTNRWLVAGLAVSIASWSSAARAHDVHDELGHPIEHEHEDESADVEHHDGGGHDHSGEGFDRYERNRGDAPAPRRGGEGFHTHDGFYLHLGFGPGALRASNDTGLLEAKVYGGGGALDVEVGLAVVENLVVFGTLGGITVVNPKVEAQGLVLGTSDGDKLILSMLGAGAGWYFSGLNLFVSGSVSAAMLRSETKDGEKIAETGTGVAASLAVGKEWWISPNWGLGAALEVTGARVPDQPNGGKLDPWRVFGASLTFSATFN